MARRKKHSAKSRLQAKADALKPPTEIRQREILEEIVDHLRPWKARKRNDEITELVQWDMNFLVIMAPFEAKRPDRTQNRIHAQKLNSVLLTVEMLLASAPPPLRDFLLNPLPTMMATGVQMAAATPSLEDDIQRANRARADAFAAELKRMREVCVRAINPGLGYHPNYDSNKNFCAMFAHGFMLHLSERPITGTKDDAFRTIASLLYEAVSGVRDADLKRACDAKLRETSDQN